MKALLLLVLASISHSAFSQSRVSADLYVGDPYLTDAGGGPLNMNSIGIGSVIMLHLDFLNLDQKKAVPKNGVRVQLNLGNKLELSPGFDLLNAPMSKYFKWTSSYINGEEQITGELTDMLPEDFAGLAVFKLQAKELGKSTAISRLLLNNTALIDPNQKNDNGKLAYTVTSLVPVTFRDFNTAAKSCDINANWSVEYQFEIDHYEVEVSKTGLKFTEIEKLTPRRSGSYTSSFKLNETLQAPVVYVRVKAVATDGTNYYSSTKAIEGDCINKKGWQLYLYPNPVTDGDFINLASREGNLDGKYRLTLMDKFGKIYQVKEMTFANVKTLRYQLSANMRPGKYILQISKSDGTNSSALEFEKL